MTFVVVLSPAKTLDLGPVDGAPPETLPRFHKEAAQLAGALRKMPAPKIKALMKISDKIAADVNGFYQEFEENPAKQVCSTPHTQGGSRGMRRGLTQRVSRGPSPLLWQQRMTDTLAPCSGSSE